MLNSDRIERRDLVVGLSTAGVIGLAGCASGESSAGDADGSNAGEETSEATPTETASSESETQHDVGEAFTVGSGEKSIRYVVEEATLARAIGTSSVNVEADGLFLIVILNMENTGDKSIDITSRHLRLVDSQGREFEADTEANTYISQDSRFDVDGILFEQLQPGLEQTRAVAFDVATEESYALMVDPAGVFSNAETHYVALGNVPNPS